MDKELESELAPNTRVVILAGGKGTRLYPYTVAIPKPLVPVGDLPIIEIMLRQLKHFGFKNVTVSIGHLAGIMAAFLGNGERFGLKIGYAEEAKPLGTVGPLKIVGDLSDHALLMNGDVLTDLDYRAFLKSHLASQADLSIAGFTKTLHIDLGVLVRDGNQLRDYIEKPDKKFDVSMGVYALKREVINLIPENEYFDFPMLVKLLLAQGRKVNVHVHNGIWLDIGRPDDYALAEKTFHEFRGRLLIENS